MKLAVLRVSTLRALLVVLTVAAATAQDTGAQPGSISGMKFHDLNGDGVQDFDEPGLAGWTVYVDYNDNGILDPGEPSAVTGPGGLYTITDVDPGTWKVREVGQTGWTNTFPAVSDGFGRFHQITVTEDDAVTNVNFGNFDNADLELTKTVAPDTAFPGDQVVFTLTVTNLGPGDATGVVVTDTLPAGMTYVSNTCGATVVGQDITWNIGNLAALAWVQCDVTVEIDLDAPPGALTNDAQVSGDQNDPTPGNAAAAATVTVGDPVSVLEIPTLSQVTLVLLSLLLAGVAVVAMRRFGA